MEAAIDIPSIDLNKTTEGLVVTENKKILISALLEHVCDLLRGSNKLSSCILFSSRGIVSFGLSPMLDLIFFRTATSVILFGSMIFFDDLFQSYGIDVQAGEQKLLAFSTLYNTAMTWLQHLLAPAMQEHHY